MVTPELGQQVAPLTFGAKFATCGTTSMYCKSVQKLTPQFEQQMAQFVLFAWVHNPFYHNNVTEQHSGIADLDV